MSIEKPPMHRFRMAMFAGAVLFISSPFLYAQERPNIPEWRPAPATGAPTSAPETNSPQLPSFSVTPPPVDQSEELVAIDKDLASNILNNGPLNGYGAFISEQGVLYDAAGGSPEGQEAVKTRFGTFPSNITMERRPEKAMASGGAGASWGAYSVKRGDTILSDGRYVTIWRKEPTGWKIVSELAAGRANSPPPLPAKPSAPNSAPLVPATGVGALPKMRDALGRPIGTRPAPTNPN